MNICEICKREANLHVDHNHVNNKIRGFICGSCNRGLGLFQDNPVALREAANYLELNQQGKIIYR